MRCHHTNGFDDGFHDLGIKGWQRPFRIAKITPRGDLKPGKTTTATSNGKAVSHPYATYPRLIWVLRDDPALSKKVLQRLPIQSNDSFFKAARRKGLKLFRCKRHAFTHAQTQSQGSLSHVASSRLNLAMFFLSFAQLKRHQRDEGPFVLFQALPALGTVGDVLIQLGPKTRRRPSPIRI